MKKMAVVCLLSLACTVGAYAQATAGLGAVSGTVRDPSGAIVPDATVTVTNDSRGIKRTVHTTESGVFNAPALVPSTGYAVTVEKSGFTKMELKDLQVQIGQDLDLALVLSIAGTNTQVQVESTAPGCRRH